MTTFNLLAAHCMAHWVSSPFANARGIRPVYARARAVLRYDRTYAAAIKEMSETHP